MAGGRTASSARKLTTPDEIFRDDKTYATSATTPSRGDVGTTATTIHGDRCYITVYPTFAWQTTPRIVRRDQMTRDPRRSEGDSRRADKGRGPHDAFARKARRNRARASTAGICDTVNRDHPQRRVRDQNAAIRLFPSPHEDGQPGSSSRRTSTTPVTPPDTTSVPTRMTGPVSNACPSTYDADRIVVYLTVFTVTVRRRPLWPRDYARAEMRRHEPRYRSTRREMSIKTARTAGAVGSSPCYRRHSRRRRRHAPQTRQRTIAPRRMPPPTSAKRRHTASIGDELTISGTTPRATTSTPACSSRHTRRVVSAVGFAARRPIFPQCPSTSASTKSRIPPPIPAITQRG